MRERIERYFLRGCYADTTVTADPGAGGATFAVDNAGASGVFPYAKMAFGASGTQTPVSSGDPLPVVADVTGNVAVSNITECDTGAVVIASGSVTVAGSVTANAGTNLNTSALLTSTNFADAFGTAGTADTQVMSVQGIAAMTPIQVGDNSSSLTVDNAGTFAVQNNGTGKTLKTASGTLTTDTDVIAAVSSKRIKVYAMNIFTVGTSANAAIFKSNGTSGTELWRFLIQAAAASPMGLAIAVTPPGFLFATTAGEKLTLDVGNADTLHYSLAYWDDDAT